MHTDPRSLLASVERTSPSIRIATAPGVEPPGRDVNADIAAFVAFAAATAIMDLIVMVSPKEQRGKNHILNIIPIGGADMVIVMGIH